MLSANHLRKNSGPGHRHQNNPYAAIVLPDSYYDDTTTTASNNRQVAIQLSLAAIGESSQTHKMAVPRCETCPFSSFSQKKEEQISMPKWPLSPNNVTENDDETAHQTAAATDDYDANAAAAENWDSGDNHYGPPCDLSFIDPAVVDFSAPTNNNNNNGELSLNNPQVQAATAGKHDPQQQHQRVQRFPNRQQQNPVPLGGLPLSCIGTVNPRTYNQQQQQQQQQGRGHNKNNKRGGGGRLGNCAKVVNPHAPRVALEGDDDCEAAYWRATRAIVDQSTVGSLIVKHRANPSTPLKDMISRIERAMRDRDGGTNVFRGVHIIRCYLEVKILFQSQEEAEAGKSLVSRHPEWFGN